MAATPSPGSRAAGATCAHILACFFAQIELCAKHSDGSCSPPSSLSPPVCRPTCFLERSSTLALTLRQVKGVLSLIFFFLIYVFFLTYEFFSSFMLLLESSADVYMKRELLESSVSAMQANEAIARCVCVCALLSVSVCVCA